MLALEIWENDNLVYSHNYFDEGAGHEYYNEVIKEKAYNDMIHCAEWQDFEGCALDEDEVVKEFDIYPTTMKTVKYSPESGWEYLDSDTMSDEFVKANMHRLPDSVTSQVEDYKRA